MDEGAGGWRRKRLGDDEGEPAGRRRGGRPTGEDHGRLALGARMGSAAAGGRPRATACGRALLLLVQQAEGADLDHVAVLQGLRGASTLSLFTHTPLKEFVSRMA